MKGLLLVSTILGCFISCSFPGRLYKTRVQKLSPHFGYIRAAILNEPDTGNEFKKPWHTQDTYLKTILQNAGVHDYGTAKNSKEEVQLTWHTGDYTYQLFLGPAGRQLEKTTNCTNDCKEKRYADSVVLQRHFTPTIITY